MSGPSKKRKHRFLSIMDKVALLKEHDKEATLNLLCKKFLVGKSTVYGTLKQKEKILRFFADSDSSSNLKQRKTLRTAKNVDLDNVLIKWI